MSEENNLHGELGWWCYGCRAPHPWDVDRWYSPDGLFYCQATYPKKPGAPVIVNTIALLAKLRESGLTQDQADKAVALSESGNVEQLALPLI